MIDALGHPGFPSEDWEAAPQYWGPGTRELQEHGRVTVLDFDRLIMLAEMQSDRGAFRPDNGIEAERAPVKIGEIPGSFIRVESLNVDDFMFHAPPSMEVMVVLNGVLRVERPKPIGLPNFTARSVAVLQRGGVVGIWPGEVKLTAYGVESHASSLVLSILGVVEDGLKIVGQGKTATPKEFDPDYRPKLPYDPDEG